MTRLGSLVGNCIVIGGRICTWEVLVFNRLSSSISTSNGTFYFYGEFDLTNGASICLLGKMGPLTQHN